MDFGARGKTMCRTPALAVIQNRNDGKKPALTPALSPRRGRIVGSPPREFQPAVFYGVRGPDSNVAFGGRAQRRRRGGMGVKIQSAVGAALCRRTPRGCGAD